MMSRRSEILKKTVEKDAKVHTYTYSAITKELKGQELVDFDANSKETIVVGFRMMVKEFSLKI